MHSRRLILILILLGIAKSVYPVRPSVLLKRSLLKRRLLTMSGMRPKRQLFREDIPHHRPLTGNTYYLHAGFPHPSRWHDGSQVIPPNPTAMTHHHLQKKPGLHDDLHNNNNNHNDLHNINNHDDRNNDIKHELQHQLVQPQLPNHEFHQHHHQNGIQDPVAISVLNNEPPHSINIYSAIVHGNSGGGIVDNTLGHPSPHPPVPPVNQANFDPLFSSLISGPVEQAIDNFRNVPGQKPEKPPKPHSEPEHYDDGIGKDYYAPPLSPPETGENVVHQKQPRRKPKTIIHYHPVTVGSIINFNDDNKPITITPSPISYGPPNHVPGIPLSNKDIMMSVAEPFIKSPFKTVNGPPEFLDFTKENVQYGPPQHVPGVPLGSLDLAPMLPSFGPPIKPEHVGPGYGVALPVIAHLHSGPPRHHHPPKHHRGKGRNYHQHHLHLHHIHHVPTVVHTPATRPYLDVQHPTYVIQGHVPLRSPRFRSHSHYHHKSVFSW